MTTDAANWLELVENPQAILSLYDDAPSLKNVYIVEVKLCQDGPRVELRANIDQFPTYPPKRWESHGYNTTQVQLSLISLYSIDISAWSSQNWADINIERREGRTEFTAHGSGCHLEVLCDFITIDSIHGYIDSELAKESENPSRTS